MIPMTYEQTQAFLNGRPASWFAEVDHPNYFIRAWTGLGTIRAELPEGAAHEFIGLGDLVSFEGLGQETQLVHQPASITLSNVDRRYPDSPDGRAFIRTDVRGRLARIMIGILDQKGHVIGRLIPRMQMRLDNISSSEDGSTARITLHGWLGPVDLGTPTDTRVTSEYQKEKLDRIRAYLADPRSSGGDIVEATNRFAEFDQQFAGGTDTGFDLMPSLRRKRTNWTSGEKR